MNDDPQRPDTILVDDYITSLKQRIAELEAELERWKVQHEEMLLKHAREQNGALSALEKALNEIARLNEIIEDLSNHGTAAEAMAMLKAQQAEIEQLRHEIERLKGPQHDEDHCD
jgi:protein subunit release factor A